MLPLCISGRIDVKLERVITIENIIYYLNNQIYLIY